MIPRVTSSSDSRTIRCNGSDQLEQGKKNPIKRKVTICGTCGRRDTDDGHPPIGSTIISCEYPYGSHNPRYSAPWLSKNSIYQLIAYNGIQQILAEERAALKAPCNLQKTN
ncbi:unnamed protein product [Calicophoron daubneyi]|uniref:Uncharacterized protein n=1 Tax=Calicophoron daubneyi TaxID=300641 RepID=A0AAV2T8K0_CALDB